MSCPSCFLVQRQRVGGAAKNYCNDGFVSDKADIEEGGVSHVLAHSLPMVLFVSDKAGIDQGGVSSRLAHSRPIVLL